MPKKGGPYLNNGVYWGNFESFKSVGGRKRPLVPDGAKTATKDLALAQVIYDKYRQQYEAAIKAGVSGDPRPGEFAARYIPIRRTGALRERGINPNMPEEQWPKVVKDDIRDTKRILARVLTAPPMQRVKRLSDITPKVLEAIQEHLEQPFQGEDGQTTTYALGTVKRNMAIFRAMLTEAVMQGVLVSNPFERYDKLPDIPRDICNPEDYLTRPEVRGVLEHVQPSPHNPFGIDQTYTLAYTGCRLGELANIMVFNVDFEMDIINIPTGKRRDGSIIYREVPLWPKHKAVLIESLKRFPRPLNGPLYPGGGKDGKTTRLRKTLEKAFAAAGVTKAPGHHIFRHSYVTSRMEMTKEVRGKLVNTNLSEIAREIGHADEEMIRRVYGHLRRAYERQDVLDFYDELPNYDARLAAWTADLSTASKAGWAKRKERLAAVKAAKEATQP